MSLLEINLKMNKDSSVAVLMHLLTFVGLVFPLGNIIAVLILWLVKRGTSEYLDEVGKEVLNFNISVIFWAILLTLLTFTVVGAIVTIPLFIILALIFIICPIIGAVKSSNEQMYSYPATIRLLK